jgi:hypothetical protein
MRTVTARTLVGLIIIGLASITAHGAARADEPPDDVAVTLTLGAGVEGFTGDSMRDVASPAATWDVRAVIDVRSAVAIEVAYLGSIAALDAPVGGQEGTLVGQGAEGLVRSDIYGVDAWHLYALLGGAWRRYTVTGADFQMPATGMNDTDDVLEFPMGIGLAYRRGGFLADARAVFRAAAEEDMILIDADDPTPGDFGTMHTWSVSARLGYQLW